MRQIHPAETDASSGPPAASRRPIHPPRARRKEAREKEEDYFPAFFSCRGLAVALQAVEVHADVGGFRRGVRQRNGAVEGGCAGFGWLRPSCIRKGAANAEEMT